MDARHATEELTIHSKVKDYSTRSRAYDADETNRASAGLSNSRVFRRAEGPNDVVALLDVADVAKDGAWSGSPDLKIAWKGPALSARPASASRPK